MPGPPGSTVAIKIFHAELVSDAQAFARFRQEAEIGKEIRHPNLVRTYEIGTDESGISPRHYMVMEVIEGRTLESLLGILQKVQQYLLEHLRVRFQRQADRLHHDSQLDGFFLQFGGFFL